MDVNYNKSLDNLYDMKGDEIQKVTVLHNLQDLMKCDANATCTRIIPKIQQELPVSSCEFHIAASRSFKYIIEKHLPVNVIPNILQGLELRDPIVVNAWLEVLIDVMASIPEDVIRKDILPLALSKSNASQSVAARIVSCALLGKLSVYPKLGQKDIKSVILPAVQSLCQDVAPDVRSAICVQIPNVCQGLGAELNKSTIISSLVELAKDNAPAVRSSAIITVVTITPSLDKEIKQSIMMPLVKQLCEKAQTRDDTTGGVITKYFGKLVNGLLSVMTNEDIVWFLQCYKKLANRGFSIKPGEAKGDPSLDMVCRDNCAYNLPAIVNLIANRADGQLDVIYGIFRDLTADPCYIVRKSVAASIHEIIRILGPNSKVIKADVVRLLRDDAEEVLQALVPNLGTILSLLGQNGILSKDKADQTTMEIGRALLKCQLELTKGYNWRLLTTLLEQLERLPECMPADFIHQHFTPVLVGNILNGRARPVRVQGTRTLLKFLKHNQKEANQKWIRDTLISNLCLSKSCYTRIIYVAMCRHALELFSPQYFKDYFLMPLMTLLDDPISNIRYSVVCLLPTLRHLLANDPKCRQILSDAIAKLESKETDKDVIAKLKSKAKELSDLKGGVVAKGSSMRKGSTVTPPFVASSSTSGQQVRSTRSNPIPASPQKTSSLRSAGKPGIQPQKTVSYTQPVQSKMSSKEVAIQKVSQSPTSDMNFLKQHFYVDAGINIPLTSHNDTDSNFLNSNLPIPLVVSNESEIEGLSKKEIDTLQSTTTNITDDVKVNLRKITSKLQQPKTYKRHSTIIPSTNFEKSNKKAINRRSLNDFSKIPIYFTTKEKVTNKGNSNKENSKVNNTNKILGYQQGDNNNINIVNETSSKQEVKNNTTKENDGPTKSSNNSKTKLPLALKKTATGTV